MNDGGPAFPCATRVERGGSVMTVNSEGMTLRDWFAGQALQGMLACLAHPSSVGGRLCDNAGVPAEAFQWADAMLAVRQKEAK